MTELPSTIETAAPGMFQSFITDWTCWSREERFGLFCACSAAETVIAAISSVVWIALLVIVVSRWHPAIPRPHEYLARSAVQRRVHLYHQFWKRATTGNQEGEVLQAWYSYVYADCPYIKVSSRLSQWKISYEVL